MSDKSIVALRSTREVSVREAVAQCLRACDWESVVPRNASVVIKPNLCTAVPDKWESSNTDPAIAEAVVEILLSRTNKIVLAQR